jgi:hypothetical protein
LEGIPFVATACSFSNGVPRPLRTPDGKNWVGDLYTKICLKLPNDKILPFLDKTLPLVRVEGDPTREGFISGQAAGEATIPITPEQEEEIAERAKQVWYIDVKMRDIYLIAVAGTAAASAGFFVWAGAALFTAGVLWGFKKITERR